MLKYKNIAAIVLSILIILTFACACSKKKANEDTSSVDSTVQGVDEFSGDVDEENTVTVDFETGSIISTPGNTSGTSSASSVTSGTSSQSASYSNSSQVASSGSSQTSSSVNSSQQAPSSSQQTSSSDSSRDTMSGFSPWIK